MSAIKLVTTLSRDGAAVDNKTINYVSTQDAIIDSENIPDAETDREYQFAIDVSALLLFYAVSDQDLTIETNDGSSAQETITLKAGVPKIWNQGEAALFAGDVDSLFITNGSGSAASLTVMACHDLPD